MAVGTLVALGVAVTMVVGIAVGVVWTELGTAPVGIAVAGGDSSLSTTRVTITAITEMTPMTSPAIGQVRTFRPLSTPARDFKRRIGSVSAAMPGTISIVWACLVRVIHCSLVHHGQVAKGCAFELIQACSGPGGCDVSPILAGPTSKSFASVPTPASLMTALPIAILIHTPEVLGFFLKVGVDPLRKNLLKVSLVCLKTTPFTGIHGIT